MILPALIDQCFDKPNTSINLERMSFDIHADSDNKHDELQEINGIQSNSNSCSKSDKARSSRKSLKHLFRKQTKKRHPQKSQTAENSRYLMVIFLRN